MVFTFLERRIIMYETGVIKYRIKRMPTEMSREEKLNLLISRSLQDEIAQLPIRSRTTYLLRLLGIPSSIRGYKYVVEAVEFVIEHSSEEMLITKFIYPFLARKYDATSERIERDIRTAISHVKVDSPYYRAIFNTEERRSNKRFICELAEFIR
jgi:two-component system response regulator (stage 0 sporulation protein A)